MSVIITCEHGGNIVPPEYSFLFSSDRNVLETHRGYDPGAIEMATLISKKINCSYVYEIITRLLVDQNRSLGNKSLWSQWSRKLTKDQKLQVLEKIYKSYHEKVTQIIDQKISDKNNIYHFSIHSFTPSLDGIERKCDIGLLYDPSKKSEKKLSDTLSLIIKKKIPEIRLRKNYPYKGTSDGLTKELRKRYGALYCGIEVELNQKHFLAQDEMWSALKKELPLCIAAL